MPIKQPAAQQEVVQTRQGHAKQTAPQAAGPAPQPAQGAHTIEMWISSRSVLRRGYEPLCPMPGLLAFGSLAGLVGITPTESERGWVRFIHTLASKHSVTTKPAQGTGTHCPVPGSVEWWGMRRPPETCRQGLGPGWPQHPTDGAGPLLDVPTAGAPHAGPTHAPSQHSGHFGPPSWHMRTASPPSSVSGSQGKGRIPALPSPYFQCSQELLLCSGPGKL